MEEEAAAKLNQAAATPSAGIHLSESPSGLAIKFHHQLLSLFPLFEAPESIGGENSGVKVTHS